jgi:hypothetical protein
MQKEKNHILVDKHNYTECMGNETVTVQFPRFLISTATNLLFVNNSCFPNKPGYEICSQSS